MNKNQLDSKPTIVSLFSGCGGMDLGFIQTGFTIIWANDIDEDCVKTYKRNIDDKIILCDIKKIDSSSIPKNSDVLLGGFPCQGFSVANIKRNMKDKRNFLYKEMLRIIKDTQPKFFVAENVKGLLSIQGGKVIKMIIKDFEDIEYKVDYRLLNAVNYGVPQFRERVFIIGNKYGIENSFPKITHNLTSGVEIQKTLVPERYENLKPVISAKETIGHLANVRLSQEPILVNGKKIYNHIAHTNVSDEFYARKHPVKQEDICDYLKVWRKKAGISTEKVDNIFGYKYTAGHWFRKDNNSGSIPKPDDWWKLKEILGFDDKYDKAVTELELRNIKFEQSLRITNWDRPSDTITATSPEIHVNKERRLSVRECAILQTFPDDFIFEGSLSGMYKQIGNAVPVLLAKAIALEIKKSLNKVR